MFSWSLCEDECFVLETEDWRLTCNIMDSLLRQNSEGDLKRLLEDAGPNLCRIDGTPCNNIHDLCVYAFEGGDPACVDILLEHIGAELTRHLQPVYEKTILDGAVKSENLGLVKKACTLLKAHGIGINTGGDYKYIMLAMETICDLPRHHNAAAQSEYTKQLQSFSLERGTSSLYSEDRTENGTLILEYLLEQGLNIDGRDVRKQTALHSIAAALNMDGVRVLLEHGADPLAADEHGRCPWWHAGASVAELTQKWQVMQVLLNAVNFVEETKIGGRFLQAACSAGWSVAVEYLLSKGVDVNCTDEKGDSLLVPAIRRAKHREKDNGVLKCLLQHGCDVNADDEAALREALILLGPVAMDNCWISKTVIEAGANVNVRDDDGHTLLMYNNLPRWGRQLLLDYGADVNIVAPDGLTLLWTSVQFEIEQGNQRSFFKPENRWLTTLLDHNIDIRISKVQHADLTPLQLAYNSHNLRLCDILLNAGCSVEHMASVIAAPNPRVEMQAVRSRILALVGSPHSLQELSRQAALRAMGQGALKDCSEIYDYCPTCESEFAVHVIQPPGGDPFLVKCYLMWGGYTYIMERYETECGKVSFSQQWVEYKAGFGDLADFVCDFWLGLEKIHRLTSNPDRAYKLDTTVAFQDPNLQEYYQTYLEGFYVEDEANGYRLHSTGWLDGHDAKQAGDAYYRSPGDGDSMIGQKFSTQDRDQDSSVSHCAQDWGAGWWFSDCGLVCPTGVWKLTSDSSRDTSISSMWWGVDPYGDRAVRRLDIKLFGENT